LEHKEEAFVTSIMKKGASIKRFLTEERFLLYLNSKAIRKTALKKLLKKHASVSAFSTLSLLCSHLQTLIKTFGFPFESIFRTLKVR